MNPVFLYNEKTGFEKEYPSVRVAARTLGVDYQELTRIMKNEGTLGGYLVRPFSVKSKHVNMEYDIPRKELDIPHYAKIDGKTFTAVKCEDKTNCTECDIFKLKPPLSMANSPLCYDYNCGTHKIVDVCSRYKCIWKRKRQNKN